MRHIIFCHSNKGICPRCGGLLRTVLSETIILNCIDCNLYLKVVGDGTADSELEFEETEICDLRKEG